MAWWGLKIESKPEASELEVLTVPELVKERLTQSKDGLKPLKELVISLIAEWKDGHRREFRSRRRALEAEPQDNDWLSLLRHVPSRLLDLINSKACRGAISESLVAKEIDERCRRPVR